MRDIPRELWIGENLWRVRFVRHIKEHPPDTLGLCDPSDHVIYIKMGQTPKERLITLLHEFGHCLEFEYKREVPHHLVEWFAQGLAELVLENVA